MWRAALKGLLARKVRLALPARAIVLCVAFVSGTLFLTDTALSAFDDLFGDIFAKTDVVVQAENAFQDIAAGGGGGGGQERNPIPEGVLADIQAVPGVAGGGGSGGGAAPGAGGGGARSGPRPPKVCSPISRPCRAWRRPTAAWAASPR